jgi:uncharacterized protein (DUF1778 family)
MNQIIKFSMAIIFLSASVASGEATMDIENNTQRAGSDYINFVTQSPEQCAKECARDSRCLAFDYSRYDSRCWLKNRVPHPRFNRDVVSGIKKTFKAGGSGSSRKNRVAGMRIDPDTQRPFGDYTNFVVESAEKCARECRRDDRCLAFDYSRYDSLCWLKNMVPQSRYNRDVVSGVKTKSKFGHGSRKNRVAGMRIDPDTQRPFGDYTNFVVESAKKCARECVRDDRCLAFDYSRYDSRCWLKNMVPQSRYNRDVVSGVKQWSSSTDRDTGSYMESNGSGNQPAANARQFDTRVQSAQEILRQKGYSPGPADGIMGKKTKNAVKKFQQDHNLSPTGILDQKTHDLLLQLKAVAPVG